MRLTQEQLAAYEQNGFLFMPDYFSPREVELLRGEVAGIFAEAAPHVVREKEGQTVRSAYGSHATNEIFKRLARHPRLVEPAMQLLGSQVYVYQSKINAKAAFSGDLWEWHQDYIFWHKEDGMPSPRVLSAALFLEEVSEFNGPLFLIPGSHREGMIDQQLHSELAAGAVPSHRAYRGSPAWISNLTADLKYALKKEAVTELVDRYGITSPKGHAGSVLFFHGNIVHGSPNNISPFDRLLTIITFNSVENVPGHVPNPRPEFLVSRDAAPVTPLPDSALLM
jgi:ectoine hydroxylase